MVKLSEASKLAAVCGGSTREPVRMMKIHELVFNAVISITIEELTVPAQTYMEPLKTHNFTYTLSCSCSHTDLFVRLMHGNRH